MQKVLTRKANATWYWKKGTTYVQGFENKSRNYVVFRKNGTMLLGARLVYESLQRYPEYVHFLLTT